MAFTEAQKVDIRLYMGWPARFHQFDSELEQAISAVETLPDTEAKVLAQITELQRLDAAIVAAEGRLKAAQVGSIKLTLEREIGMLRDRGRQEVGRMATIFGVEPGHDVYSGRLPKSRWSRQGRHGAGNYRLQG